MSDTLIDRQLVETLRGRVANELTRAKQQRAARGEPELSIGDERQLALSLITATVQRHLTAVLAAGGELPADPGFDLKLIMAVDAAIFEAAEFQDVVKHPDIENVDINGCDEVFITYADDRGKVRGRPIAATDDDLIQIVQNLASYASMNARPFTPANPELDLRLPDGSRLSAVMSATERPVVSIRRSRYPQMFLSTLIQLGTIDDQLACFLQAAVLARMNLVIAGATDAGKTSLLRALINVAPPDERLIIVERSLELGIRRHPDLHHDVVEMEEVLPDADGNGGLTIRDLVRRTRRHNPSRVVVGEVLGPEVVEMMSAMSQGNNGSLSTIHSRSATDVFAKLATYAAQYERLDFSVAHSLIANAVDFVVFIEKNRALGGRRCVTEVREVVGSPDGRVASGLIFCGSPVDGRAVRADEFGLTFERNKALHAAGYDDTAHTFVFGGR